MVKLILQTEHGSSEVDLSHCVSVSPDTCGGYPRLKDTRWPLYIYFHFIDLEDIIEEYDLKVNHRDETLGLFLGGLNQLFSKKIKGSE